MKDAQIHAEHRRRVKEKFRESGLNSFSDHEVLELLLFFGIPYKNTNETAHKLINRFHSLSGVLDADFGELVQQDGIGENAATLLTFLPQLMRRYAIDKTEQSVIFDTPEKIGEYLVDHFIGATREQLELLLFDAKMQMIDHVTLHDGSVSSVAVNPEKIAELLFSKRASNFVLAHNHPSGGTEPSAEDLSATRKLYRAFIPFNKYLVEHIIVSGDKYERILSRALDIFN